MPTKVTIKTTARRKDGQAKGTVAKRTVVKSNGTTAVVSRSRNIIPTNKARTGNVRTSKTS